MFNGTQRVTQSSKCNDYSEIKNDDIFLCLILKLLGVTNLLI